MTNDENPPPFRGRAGRKRSIALSAALLLALASLFFRRPIVQRLSERTILANDAPSETMIKNLLQGSSDPASVVVREWNTGKIVPRELALRFVDSVAPRAAPCPAALEEILLAGALDPDENARETALGTLNERHDSALAGLATAQLQDADPQVRMMGLEYVKAFPRKTGLAVVAPLLNDPDPRVTAKVVLLMNAWCGEDFGVKLRDLFTAEDLTSSTATVSPQGLTKLQAATKKAAAWLRDHPGGVETTPVTGTRPILPAGQRVFATDFSLRDLEGHSVRLTDFRGKVVLLNFWTTWCTACVGETANLIELQKRHHDDVVILGTSLDSTPDDDAPAEAATPASIRTKVTRVARQRGVNYPVLLDETGAIGARYNGGELPTTVIIDANGYVRRRFVGARDIKVLEAFIAEAARPL